MHLCTTSRADAKRGNPDVYQCNMTSGLPWIIRACLFQVCLWRACLCEEPVCYEYLTDMVNILPKDYLFRVNKSEETFERVEKALSRFYGENCKKDFKCKDYKENTHNSAVCYLMKCLDVEKQEPKCVSNVKYSLAEVVLVSLKDFKCLVEDAFNYSHNASQEVREQSECDAVFVDAVRCQKATALEASSIPPKTSSSTATTTSPPQPSSSLTPSTISNSGNMGEFISVSMLLAISLIANIILLLGVFYLWTWERRQHEGLSPAMPELEVLNAVENGNGDALQH